MFQNTKLCLLMIACVPGLPAVSFADSNPEDATAYVDSAFEWGSWELGLQPAAGGRIPSPQRAVRNINADVKFRPNANNTYAPTSQPVSQSNIRPTPLPPPPPLPVTPGTGTTTVNNAPTGSPCARFGC